MAEGELPGVELGRTERRIGRVGLGAMPLSLAGRPPAEVGRRVVRRAVELGVDLIDTADVYCVDDGDVGHNERLIRDALAELGLRAASGPVLVATKGGLTRPGGAWERDARPERLREACERSRQALGVERVDVYQLHAPDPRVPLERSVEALARLRSEGAVAEVGLSNVDLGQLERALEIVPIVSVQNRFNPWDRGDEANGLLAACRELRITYIAYSPVGGGRRVKLLRGHEPLRRLGRRVGASPEELVLAWLLSRSPAMVVIPGASRPASIESSVRAGRLQLTAEDLSAVEATFDSLPP